MTLKFVWMDEIHVVVPSDQKHYFIESGEATWYVADNLVRSTSFSMSCANNVLRTILHERRISCLILLFDSQHLSISKRIIKYWQFSFGFTEQKIFYVGNLWIVKSALPIYCLLYYKCSLSINISRNWMHSRQPDSQGDWVMWMCLIFLIRYHSIKI